jgi:hypothetical protein
MCQNTQCPVHERINVREDVTKEFGSGRAFTYEGDYCVLTIDNPNYGDPMLALGIMLGEVEKDAMPGMFMTLVVKVGDKAVGDLSPEELTASTVHREDFVKLGDPALVKWGDKLDMTDAEADEFAADLTEMFHDKHDEAVLAVQSGLIS